MYDLSNDSRSIWKELKHGSLGTVLWALRGDERVVLAFSESLSCLHSVDQLADSLDYPVFVAGNCIGQVALHQIAADDSAQPHLEPRDSRWSPLRALATETAPLMAKSIATQREFVAVLERLLSRTINDIMSGAFKRIHDLQFVSESAEVYQQFLVYMGIALAIAIDGEHKTLPIILGEVAKLNETTDAPQYPFRTRRIKPSEYG